MTIHTFVLYLFQNSTGSAILKKKVKELDEKMEALKEAVEVNELEGPGDCDTVVIVKIENPEESEEQEENGSLSKRREDEADVQESGVEKEEEEPEKLEDIKKNGENTSKQTNEKWDNIWDKICPDIDQAKNKLLKKKVCALLAKCVPKGEDLCKKLEGMSLGGDKNGLKAKGPGQTTYHNADMSPQYSPAYLHSPGQMTTLSSPPHEGSVLPSFAILQNDMKVNSGATDMYQWNLGNNYHSVSPPNMSYQSDHSISDVECNMNHVSPQSLDDGPQDIPTVMAQAMYLIVPGDSQPTVCNQDLVNQWDSPSASTSSQHQASGIDGRTDYDVQTWPGMDSPSSASFHGNPPSVSSISDVDSVFGSPSPYNNPEMSPASAVSGGSAVHSPAPTPPSSSQWYPPQTSAPVASERYMTITSSSNINFGVVQVQRPSNSCSSPPHLLQEVSPEAQIRNIEKYLKETEPQHQVLPPIDSIFPTGPSHPRKAPSTMRATNCNATPYARPPNATSPLRSYTEIGQVPAVTHQPITITESPPLYSPPREENAIQTCGYEQSIHQRNAFRLSADELLQRDCSDPYEGEK